MTDETKKRTRKRKKKRPTDSEMLEDLLEKIHEKLRDKGFEPKVADFLKVLEMKYKLKLTGDGKEKLLELIENVRREELEKRKDDDKTNDVSA